jgi:hypothetical protein
MGEVACLLVFGFIVYLHKSRFVSLRQFEAHSADHTSPRPRGLAHLYSNRKKRVLASEKHMVSDRVLYFCY